MGNHGSNHLPESDKCHISLPTGSIQAIATRKSSLEYGCTGIDAPALDSHNPGETYWAECQADSG
jgi:hypothetical protein